MNNNSAFPLMISVVVMDAAQLAAVYSLLGGTSALAVGAPAGNVTASPAPASAPTTASPVAATADTSASGAEASLSVGEDSSEVDAHGWAWSPDLHASTKGKTKDGLWRMKVGVTRPDPKPGFPVDNAGQSADTGTSSATEANSATSQTVTEPASAPAATSGPEEDDEFAAFRAASEASEATDAAAAAAASTARNWSDADLGALCNQAAVKLGDPSPIKEIIAQYVPAGEVAHSRNIPAEKREDFAKAVEAKAGIEFAG